MKKIAILIAVILAVQLLAGALTAGAAPVAAGPYPNGSGGYYTPGPAYHPGYGPGPGYQPAYQASAGSYSVYYLYCHCTYSLSQPYAPWPFWWMYPPLPGGCQP